ncbi:hypothetical protein [Hydrogenophaga sp.]|uniref:hypothetical protein n=1 Tax=Hydrogenophaga sp. TaxID=1904254 RepID=UPI0035B170AF
MADYAIEGGRLLQAWEVLGTPALRNNWHNRFPAREVVTAGQQQCKAMNPSAAASRGSAPAQALRVVSSQSGDEHITH